LTINLWKVPAVLSPLWRPFRVLGVGAAKTGTHSLGTMFADRVRSAHEADAQLLIAAILDRWNTGNDRVQTVLAERDFRRRLKIDASQVNIYLLKDFEALFRGNRFVLTIRSPFEWLRSMIDDSLRRSTSETWIRFREFRFRQNDGFSRWEQPLEARGLFPIAGYLNYWREAIERVVDSVPECRLLITRVEHLADRSAEIAAFCGIRGGAVAGDKAHEFANPERFRVLREIDRRFLLDTADHVCGDTFRKYFPGSQLEDGLIDISARDRVPKLAMPPELEAQ